jgi:D-alanyl-D-alanine dipeptidase
VAERLVAADAALPDGVSLLVLECHRPLELQRIFWDTDLAALKKRHPEWSDEKLSKETLGS